MDTERSLTDDYDLGPRLGAGGFGEVFRAVHRSTGRAVAVKIAHALPSDEERRRIFREVSLLGRFRNPRVASLEAVYDDSERGLALVYEFVEGRTLLDAVEEPPDPETLAGWVRDLAEGVGALHEAGIVHRDLKPENVMLEPEGHLRILDFGIARAIEEGQTLTHTGILLGTPGFIPPEGMVGARPSPQGDIYAIGALLYWILEGRPPFSRESPVETLEAQRREPLPALTAWGGRAQETLGATLAKALAPDPLRRPSSAVRLAARVAADLERLQRGGPHDGPAPPAGGSRRLAAAGPVDPQADTPKRLRRAASGDTTGRRRVVRRRRRMRVLFGCLATLGLALVVAGLRGRPEAPTEVPPPPVGTVAPEAGVPEEGPLSPGFADRLQRQLADAQGRLVDEQGNPAPEGAAPGDPGVFELLSRDLLRAGVLRDALPALREFDDWLAGGGRPEELPSEAVVALSEVDEHFLGQDLPAPFAAYLDLPARGGLRPGPYPPEILESWRGDGHGWELRAELPGRARAAALTLARASRLLAELGREARERPEDVHGLAPHLQASPVLSESLASILDSLYKVPSARPHLRQWMDPGRILLERGLYHLGRALGEETEVAEELAAVLGFYLSKDIRPLFLTDALFRAPRALLANASPAPEARHLRAVIHGEQHRYRSRYRLAPDWPEQLVARLRGVLAAEGRGDGPWSERLRTLAAWKVSQMYWHGSRNLELPEIYLDLREELARIDSWRRPHVALQVLLALRSRGDLGRVLEPSEARRMVEEVRVEPRASSWFARFTHPRDLFENSLRIPEEDLESFLEAVEARTGGAR